MSYADGTKYVGNWKNNKYHGKGTMHYVVNGVDAGKFIGEHINGAVSKGKIFFPDGREMIIDEKTFDKLKKELQ